MPRPRARDFDASLETPKPKGEGTLRKVRSMTWKRPDPSRTATSATDGSPSDGSTPKKEGVLKKVRSERALRKVRSFTRQRTAPSEAPPVPPLPALPLSSTAQQPSAEGSNAENEEALKKVKSSTRQKPTPRPRSPSTSVSGPSQEEPVTKKAKTVRKVKSMTWKRPNWKPMRVETDISGDSDNASVPDLRSPSSTKSSARLDQEYNLLRYWSNRLQKKPYSAITVQVERLTSEQYDEDDFSGIPDLIEVVRLQSSGPTEAARALRKKLKYGNVHRQLRALTILDGLIQNAGPRFQRVFADEALLERLRVAGTDPVTDPEVRAKCKQLFGQWSVTYKDTPGMERIVALYKQLPQRKKPVRQQQSKVLRETEEQAGANDDFTDDRMNQTVTGTNPLNPGLGPSRPTAALTPTNSGRVVLSPGPTLLGKGKKDKKKKGQGFNVEREKPQMLQSIANSSVASTNLMNALKLINREDRRVSEDPEVMKRFETCKQLRRQLLRYIQNVESDDFLGGLIHANDELVTALMAFEVLDKSIDDDSDSELEEAQHQSRTHAGSLSSPDEGFAGLALGGPPKPPRPGALPMPVDTFASGKGKQVDSESEELEEDDDENNPFGDRNAEATPAAEKAGYRWN
ncbi:MAG: hypothetical protein Q9227_001977 [Pyrenula ochraceoflavens]